MIFDAVVFIIGRIVLSDGKIVAKEQYTTDITKAKNFGKYKLDI